MKKHNFNCGWQFENNGVWENVMLPHTPKIEKIDVTQHFQGISRYKKEFLLPKEFVGKRLILEFEAVMQVTEVFVNGKLAALKKCGYLPIVIDITDMVDYDGINIIEVVADNSDNKDVPPGKPLSKLDFSYFGGIYRNVWIKEYDKLAVTHPILANKTAGGGIFVTYKNITEKMAEVNVKIDIENCYKQDKKANITCSIWDKDKNKAAEAKDVKIIRAGAEVEAEFMLTVENPKLWSPESPYLYTLKVCVSDDEKITDENEINIGIRHIKIDGENGFYLNFKPYRIRGTNRHQQFPYLGNAVSDNAHVRDAIKLKDAGFNAIRTGHYPQSESFLDAADRLGMLIISPTPGWQWCAEGEFKEQVKTNIREMIRRDRNHPSIVFWELSLNETGDLEESKWGEGWEGATDEFFIDCKNVGKEEFPTDQFLTSGDTFGRRNPEKVGYDAPHPSYSKKDDLRENGRFVFIREYGDFEFGGNYSTTRQTRASGELGLLLSAWNFIWSLNKLQGNTGVLGSCNWVGIDYNRGYFPEFPICTCGTMDIMRVAKFSYYFYKSQSKAEPCVYIAGYWQGGKTSSKVVVFSNCEQVELFVNGKSIRKQQCDSGENNEYMMSHAKANPFYWGEQCEITEAQEREAIEDNLEESYLAGRMYDGGNCKNLDFPPFTFMDVLFEAGELKAVGYIGGKPVAEHKRVTSGKKSKIKLAADDKKIPLKKDGNDFVFVYAKVCDKDCNPVYDATDKVTFKVRGGEIIGPDTLFSEGGLCGVLVRGKEDEIYVTASSENLDSDEIIL